MADALPRRRDRIVAGRGGMGIAYEAWDSQLQGVVALKMLRYSSDADAGEICRLRAEAQAIARTARRWWSTGVRSCVETRTGRPWVCRFPALAHNKLRQKDQARRWLGKAVLASNAPWYE